MNIASFSEVFESCASFLIFAMSVSIFFKTFFDNWSSLVILYTSVFFSSSFCSSSSSSFCDFAWIFAGGTTDKTCASGGCLGSSSGWDTSETSVSGGGAELDLGLTSCSGCSTSPSMVVSLRGCISCVSYKE